MITNYKSVTPTPSLRQHSVSISTARAEKKEWQYKNLPLTRYNFTSI